MNKLAAEGLGRFAKICAQEKSGSKLLELLQFFLTPEEQEQLGMRLLLTGKLLQAESTQREIAQELHVSIAKITRGSNNLKLLSDKLKQYLIKVCNN